MRGSIADWERWTGRAFPRSGEYDVPGALAKVRIDREAGIGEYDELLSENPIWRERTVGLGLITTEECLARSIAA